MVSGVLDLFVFCVVSVVVAVIPMLLFNVFVVLICVFVCALVLSRLVECVCVFCVVIC